jgi:3-hydroxybutyryl-CoA dehydratase
MTSGKSIDELRVGDSAQISKTITETDINDFARATGDFNPVHLDQAYAEKTIFKGRIVYGVFSFGLISNVFGISSLWMVASICLKRSGSLLL